MVLIVPETNVIHFLAREKKGLVLSATLLPDCVEQSKYRLKVNIIKRRLSDGDTRANKVNKPLLPPANRETGEVMYI